MPVECVLLTARLVSAVVAPMLALNVTEPLPAVTASVRAPLMVLLNRMLPPLLASVLLVSSVTAPVRVSAPVVVSVPASVMPPALTSNSGSTNVAVLTVMAPVCVLAPMVIRLKPLASAAMSVAVRSSAAVPSAPPTTIKCVLVNNCRLSVPVPLMLLAPPLKSISSALMLSAPAPMLMEPGADTATLPLLIVRLLPPSARAASTATLPVPAVRRTSALMKVSALLTVSTPLPSVRPMVMALKPLASAAISTAVRSSAAVPCAPPSTISSAAVRGCRVMAPLPVTLLAPPLKSISSALMVMADAPATSPALKAALAALSVTACASATRPV